MKLDGHLADEIVKELADELEVVEPTALPISVCRDKDDDWVLATALAGRSEVIVTGDNDLLILKKVPGNQNPFTAPICRVDGSGTHFVAADKLQIAYTNSNIAVSIIQKLDDKS